MRDGGGARALEGHIVAELGMALAVAGDTLHGAATVVPELVVPGADQLRTAVLAVWTDLVAGLLVGVSIAPRVPVTLDLDVHVGRPVGTGARVEAVGRTLKRGRTVTVVGVDFLADARPMATATASFVPSPDPTRTLPPVAEHIATNNASGRLRHPLPERARCRRTAPGVAELPRAADSVNASDTINGGLIALAVEEAALSVTGDRAALASLALRYLRPARVGPVVATAEVGDGLGRVTVRDAGSDDRVTAVATTRAGPPAP